MRLAGAANPKCPVYNMIRIKTPPVTNGMDIFTRSVRVVGDQRLSPSFLAFLLLNHNPVEIEAANTTTAIRINTGIMVPYRIE